MDLKNPTTQKIVIGSLALFIVVYFWYSRVYSQYNEKIDAKRQEFEMITTNLRNVEMKAKSLDALKLEYEELVGRYEEIETLLPEVKQIPSILVQLHTASSLTGTRITKVEPEPVNSHEFYNQATFKIEMTGTYHDFGAFIGYVANFPFIANLQDMQIKALDQKSGQSGESDNGRIEVGKKKETISASFTLSTYYVKEEERLAELTFPEKK
jgi:type IV pilus assembly protein PilO